MKAGESPPAEDAHTVAVAGAHMIHYLPIGSLLVLPLLLASFEALLEGLACAHDFFMICRSSH